MYLLVTKQVKQVPCFVNFVNNFSLFRNFEKPIKFEKEDGSEKGIKIFNNHGKRSYFSFLT